MDIARAAGVGRSTVSLALRGDPRCAAATRKRVRALAAQMGYRPDPGLSALVAHREDARRHKASHNVALLTRQARPNSVYLNMIFDGLAVELEREGYGFERYSLNDPSTPDPARLGQILAAKGVRGLVWGYLDDPRYLNEFPWDDFAHVGFLLPLVRPAIDRVRDDAYRNVLDAMAIVQKAGFQRPGLALATSRRSENDRFQRAAYLLACEEMGWDVLPTARTYEKDSDSFANWFEQHRPDVIIGNVGGIYWRFIESGVRIPDDAAYLNLERADERYPGFEPQEKAISTALAEMLIRNLRHNQLGMSATPMTHLVRRVPKVPEIWRAGKPEG